jgi:hypothetical protein
MAEKETVTPEPEKMVVETAFIVLRNKEGFWQATTDLTTPFDAERTANATDIRIGCSEMITVVNHNELLNSILSTLTQVAMQAGGEAETSPEDSK